MLVETQWPDGRWVGMGDPVGTCFALLVLKRSNFAKDLQLAVQEPPSPAMPDVSGPIILQGPDAFLGQGHEPQGIACSTVAPGAARFPPFIISQQLSTQWTAENGKRRANNAK